MIRCRDLAKSFRIYRKNPGIWGSLTALWTRDYSEHKAVDDLNLEVDAGEIVGLLGPNGAGKTTLMKMFTGIIVPSSGELSVLGFQPWLRPLDFRRQIALVMGQKSQLWWDIPAMDSLELLLRYYELDVAKGRRRIAQLAELLGVQSQLCVHVRKLSLGERMKLELMACLLHDPKIVFLDEPTIGLDLISQRRIRQFLLDYHREHKITILLTSHYMADVKALCKRIVLVLNGQKRFDGPIEDFERIQGTEKFVTFTFSTPQAANHPLLAPWQPRSRDQGNSIELRIPEKELRNSCARILLELPVIDFATEQLPIERVLEDFMQAGS